MVILTCHLVLNRHSWPPQSTHSTLHTKIPAPPLPLIRSKREIKTPSHLKDDVLSLPTLKTSTSPISTTTPKNNQNNLLHNALFNKHHYITHDVIASKIQALVEIICCDSKPYSYEEATLSPAWQKSMEKEFDALHAK